MSIEHNQNFTELKPEDFKKGEHMWCSHCDDVFVTKNNEGKYWRVFGHDPKDGNYIPVIFSLCTACIINSQRATNAAKTERRLKSLEKFYDTEAAHAKANELLAEFVRGLGFPEVAAAFEEIEK